MNDREESPPKDQYEGGGRKRQTEAELPRLNEISEDRSIDIIKEEIKPKNLQRRISSHEIDK